MLAVAGLLGHAAPVCGQATALDAFVGRDLWEDTLSAEERALLNKIVGETPEDFRLPRSPRNVWKTARDGSPRYVVFLAETLVIIPGESSACVLLLDGKLQRLGNWCFQTGWRLSPTRASFEFSAALGCDLLTLEITRYVNGCNVTKEYLALCDDRLQFLRIEGEEGEAVQNEYVYPHYEIGFPPEAKTEEAWIGLLQSGRKTDTLSALVFLGGRHIAERPFFSGESKYAGFFEQLMSSPRIRESIAALANSEDEWIRQAARLASRGPRDRPFW